jgi:two-component system cell cycle sensor histidine kinase/response regulator CckA
MAYSISIMSEHSIPNISETINVTETRLKRYYPGRYSVAAVFTILLSFTMFVMAFVKIWHGSQLFVMQSVAAILFLCGICFAYLAYISLSRHFRDRSILKEIFEGSSSARLVTDIQNKTLFYNAAFEDLCHEDEMPSLQVIRRIFDKSNDPEITDRLEALIDKAMRGHEDFLEASVPDQYYTNWIRLAAQPVAGWLGTIHWRVDDITERRAIETVVREEREKLVDFTDHAPVGFYAMDETGRFTFINATLARWLGSDIESLLSGGRLHAYLENPITDSRPYDIIVDGGAKQVAELKMKGPGGRSFSASINQSVVHETDKTVRVRGVVHDLTSEREMRQALRDSEDRFRRFFEEAPLGIAIIDAAGKITDSNEVLAEMVDAEPHQLDGVPFIDLVIAEDRHKVDAKFAKAKGRSTKYEPIDISLASRIEGNDNVAVQMHPSAFQGDYIAIRIFDRTEQKSLEAQFAQSQKMQAVGQLAGGVAHDFNNLLTAMIGFCDLLLLRHKAGDPSFNDIMQIKQNSNRAANLVRQLLAFSRQQQLNPKVLDITETLTELSHLIRRLIGVQIDLDLIHSPVLDAVKVDEGQLEQVLINLVVNARDAMDSRGRLEIETENLTTEKSIKVANDLMPAGHWVAIHVRDTGSGMDEDTIERIFEPFFTTKDIGAGTGLGLATVYGIVRQTGGYIQVQSELNVGTTFTLYLPKFTGVETEQKDISTTDKKIEEDLTGTATILLVEDEDAVRMFSSRALSNKGYNVLEAVNGENALEVIADHQGTIDLMVTDVIMPEMDGPTLAKQVIKDFPDLPIVFVSGYTEDRFKEEIGDNAHFLAKPFTLQQLAVKIKEILK